MSGLVEIFVGWPLAASLALAVVARGWHGGRRRGAVDEALHELRRPLQSLVLAAGSGAPAPVVEGSAVLADAALDRLERAIDGDTRPPATELAVLAPRPLAEAAVARWKSRAGLGGGSLDLRWHAGDALVAGDGFALSQALDNLIVNAIEHGGPAIVVEARSRQGRLQVTVADSGRASRPGPRPQAPAAGVAGQSRRGRRGHGLMVVRGVAARHGGGFELRRSSRGSRAVLELPLASGGIEPDG
jgi:signal transduction histidine kinase